MSYRVDREKKNLATMLKKNAAIDKEAQDKITSQFCYFYW